MTNNFFKRSCVLAISLSLLGLSAPHVSYARIVGTAAVLEAGQRDVNLATVKAVLDRSDVRERFLALGVEPAQVDARLASLSDVELSRLAEQMDSMPAGGNALAVIGLLFIVLLILEVVGAIDIFKKR